MKDEFTEAAIGEDAHVTTVSLYAEHLRRTKEKAEKKKSVRKSKKKKKKKKKNLPIPMERCEEALSVNTGIKHIFGLIAVKSIGDGAPEKRSEEHTSELQSQR